jgi:hypothetical protein
VGPGFAQYLKDNLGDMLFMNKGVKSEIAKSAAMMNAQVINCFFCLWRFNKANMKNKNDGPIKIAPI